MPRVIYWGLFACALAGCGSAPSGPRMVGVTGSVTLDGTILSDAVVTIIPATGGRAQSATTDKEGKFKTESVEGDHKVGVSKVESTGVPSSSDGLAPDFSAAPPPKVKVIVPARYNNPEMSSLTVKIPAGGGDVGAIPLTSK